MSRVSKFISVAAIAFAAVACGGSKENAAEKANIDGVLAAAPSSEVVLSVLELDQISVREILSLSMYMLTAVRSHRLLLRQATRCPSLSLKTVRWTSRVPRSR